MRPAMSAFPRRRTISFPSSARATTRGSRLKKERGRSSILASASPAACLGGFVDIRVNDTFWCCGTGTPAGAHLLNSTLWHRQECLRHTIPTDRKPLVIRTLEDHKRHLLSVAF